MQNLINKAFAWTAARPIELRDEEGQTVVEYALVVGLISMVLIVALLGFGNSIITAMQTAVDAAI